MSKKKQPSLTHRIGGNKAIVLGVVILLLVLFTVADLVPRFGGSAGSDFVRFAVHGRVVEFPATKIGPMETDWHRFRGALGGAGRERFFEELMLAELAKDAGIVVTDGTLREWIETLPIFTDASGAFDPARFDEGLEKYFRGISVRAFEENARRYLLVGQYQRMYGNSFLIVTDAEAHERWKREHPKVAVAYTWQAVGPIRETMDPGSLEDAEVERYWSNPRVQEKHKLPKRYRFRAAFVSVEGAEDDAYLAARREWKDEPGLRLGEEEAYAYWSERREYEFPTAKQTEETLATLRKENEAYDAWRKENGPFEEEAAGEGKAPGEPAEGPADGSPDEPAEESGDGPADEAPKEEPAPAALPLRAQFDRYWRFRVEKEIWLRKLMAKILETARSEAAADPEVARPLEGAAEKWNRSGLGIGFTGEKGPFDQYEVEKTAGLGGPVRFAMNTYRPADAGKFHEGVLPQSNVVDVLSERGWAIFRVMEVIEPEVPPLGSVREKVVAEILDERAAEEARTKLERVRKSAEDARRPLEEVAAEEGLPVATAGPFHEYSWRPPLPRVPPGEKPPPASEGWQDADRRLSAVMGKYFFFREVPVGAFGAVIDDGTGTGAFYLVQVKERAEPKFEEMTEAQIAAAKRQIRQERSLRVGTELDYASLKDRFALTIGGEPAPDPGADRDL